jgi:hypothetical protein
VEGHIRSGCDFLVHVHSCSFCLFRRADIVGIADMVPGQGYIVVARVAVLVMAGA